MICPIHINYNDIALNGAFSFCVVIWRNLEDNEEPSIVDNNGLQIGRILVGLRRHYVYNANLLRSSGCFWL